MLTLFKTDELEHAADLTGLVPTFAARIACKISFFVTDLSCCEKLWPHYGFARAANALQESRKMAK
jgi:hypothetical protein